MAGNILFKIKVDNKASPQFKKLAKDMNNLKVNASGLGKSMGTAFMWSGIYKVVSGFTRLLAGSTQAVLDFDKALHRLKGLADGTDKWIKGMSVNFRSLALAVEHSSAVIANSYVELTKAGFTAAESATAVPAILDAVTASGGDFTTTMNSVSSTLRVFGIDAKYTSDVLDEMQYVVDSTPMSMEELQEAMKNVQPVAKAVGVSMEDLVVGIGSLSKAGVKGSKAGMQMKNLLLNLQKPTGVLAEKMKDLNTQGMTLADYLEFVGNDTSIIQYLETVGKRAVVAGKYLSTAADSTRDLYASMEQNAHGSVERRAEEMRQSYALQFEMIKNNIQNFVVNTMEAFKQLSSSDLLTDFNTYLKNINRVLIQSPESLSLFAKAVKGLGDAMLFTIKNLGAIIGQLVILKTTLIALKATAYLTGKGITSVAKAIEFMKAASLSFSAANPIVLALAAISSAAFAVYTQVKKANGELENTILLKNSMQKQDIKQNVLNLRKLQKPLELTRDPSWDKNSHLSKADFQNKYGVLPKDLESQSRNIRSDFELIKQSIDGINKQFGTNIITMLDKAGQTAFRKLQRSYDVSDSKTTAKIVAPVWNKLKTQLAESIKNEIKAQRMKLQGQSDYSIVKSNIAVGEQKDTGGGGRGGYQRKLYDEMTFFRAIQELPDEMTNRLKAAYDEKIIPEFTDLFRFEKGNKEEMLKKYNISNDQYQVFRKKEWEGRWSDYTRAIDNSMGNKDNSAYLAMDELTKSFKEVAKQTNNSLKVQKDYHNELMRLWSEQLARLGTEGGKIEKGGFRDKGYFNKFYSPKSRDELKESYKLQFKTANLKANDQLKSGELTQEKYDENMKAFKAQSEEFKKIYSLQKEESFKANLQSYVDSGNQILEVTNQFHQVRLDQLKEQAEKELSILAKREEGATSLAGVNEKRKWQVKLYYASKKEQLEADQAESQGEIMRKQQNLQMAMTAMNTATAIMQVWSDPSLLTFASKGIASLALAAKGAQQLSTIQAQKLAFGGAVTGRGGSASDSVPVMLSKGEHIIPSNTVQQMGGSFAVDRAIDNYMMGQEHNSSGDTYIIENLYGDEQFVTSLANKINEQRTQGAF